MLHKMFYMQTYFGVIVTIKCSAGYLHQDQKSVDRWKLAPYWKKNPLKIHVVKPIIPRVQGAYYILNNEVILQTLDIKQ